MATNTAWIDYYFVALATVHFGLIFLSLGAARLVGGCWLGWAAPDRKAGREACDAEKRADGVVVARAFGAEIIQVSATGEVCLRRPVDEASGAPRCDTEVLNAFNSCLNKFGFTASASPADQTQWSLSDGKRLSRFSDGMIVPAPNPPGPGRGLALMLTAPVGVGGGGRGFGRGRRGGVLLLVRLGVLEAVARRDAVEEVLFLRLGAVRAGLVRLGCVLHFGVRLAVHRVGLWVVYVGARCHVVSRGQQALRDAV